MEKRKASCWKRLLFSDLLLGKSHSQKLAYIGVMTAFCVVANLFFEFKLAETQFSLTIAVSALTGILLGAGAGFFACFLGDLLGFLCNTGGFAYMPWVGLSMGLTALLAGVWIAFLQGNGKAWFLYVKIAVLCLSTFLLCTVAVNTTAFWLLYAPKVPYGTYLVSRLFIKGQIWNSLLNFTLLFAIIPLLQKRTL